MLGDPSAGEAEGRLVGNVYLPAVVLRSSFSGSPSSGACVHPAVSLEVVDLHPW
jgi:hypothetical protein